MQPGHHLRQFFNAEVLRPLAGIEGIDTEIDRIGPVGDGGLETVPVTGWGEQFRVGQGRLEVNRRAASNCRNAWAVPWKRQCQGSYITPC